MMKEELTELLNKFHSDYKEEMKNKECIIEFINRNEILLGKKNKDGHITASAWIVNKDRSKVLLTYHRKLNQWIQLGGHTEDNENVLCAALREAKEESGLLSLRVVSDEIFDLDIHRFPAHKNEKEHYHFDIRFIFEADDSEIIRISNESKDVRWIDFNKINELTNEEAMGRMSYKTSKF